MIKSKYLENLIDALTILPGVGRKSAQRMAYQLLNSNPEKYFLCDQYANDNNWLSHYHGTAEEIINQMEDPFEFFVGGIGTGGSITGIGRKLKETYSSLKLSGWAKSTCIVESCHLLPIASLT